MIAGSSHPRTGTRAVTFEALKTTFQYVIIHRGRRRRHGDGEWRETR